MEELVVVPRSCTHLPGEQRVAVLPSVQLSSIDGVRDLTARHRRAVLTEYLDHGFVQGHMAIIAR
ncbi:hypothetical protein BIV02_11725 [Curtobacterium sp. MMLR14_014]|nr:hypothetical protein BIU91_09730 [Curtobacterium sp. MMLR14_002]OII45631.1 hypothetical protein BIV02_11725 [Curtobacterium sp. MMLR14_014]